MSPERVDELAGAVGGRQALVPGRPNERRYSHARRVYRQSEIERSIDLNWLLLIGAEALAWVFTAVFIVIRYWLEWRRASVLVLAVVVLDTLCIFGLGLVDWIRTGAVSAYQIVIGALVLYVLTLGHRDMQRLDRWLGKRIAQLKARADRDLSR